MQKPCVFPAGGDTEKLAFHGPSLEHERSASSLKLALCRLSDSMAVTDATLSMKVLNKTYFFFCAIFIP